VEEYEPHATGNVRGIECVVPYFYDTIAWAAALRYSAKGSLPPGNKTFIKVKQTRETTVRRHDKNQSAGSWSVTEFIQIDSTGKAVNLDDHATVHYWEPRWKDPAETVPGDGVCAIRSLTTLEMSLVICPNAKTSAFGGKKRRPNGKVVKSAGKSRGNDADAKKQSSGSYEPFGWKGKKWVAKYKMNTPHCSGYPTLEPENPAIAPSLVVSPLPTKPKGTPTKKPKPGPSRWGPRGIEDASIGGSGGGFLASLDGEVPHRSDDTALQQSERWE
jgi:hypothetical protein